MVVIGQLEFCLQLSMRQGEHDALQRLLDYVQQPKADKGNPLSFVTTALSLAVVSSHPEAP